MQRLFAAALAAWLLVCPVRAAETLSAADFSGGAPLLGVFLTEVPADCRLTLPAGRTVRAGEALTAAQLGGLAAEALGEGETAVLRYVPVGADGPGAETVLTLSLRPAKNRAPEARDSAAETYKNLAVTGRLDCGDPDGDALVYVLRTAPRRGTVVFGRDGTYTYTPDREKVGEDRFTYCVRDAAGLTSAEAEVTVTIRKPRLRGTFADMAGDPDAAAACFLREAGLLSGEEVGGVLCFGPEKTVTRTEFLLMLLRLRGLGPERGAAGEDWLAPWTAAALRAGIPAGETAVDGTGDIFTGEDAARMTAALLDVPAGDGAAEALAEQGMDGFAACTDRAVTRRDAARLLFALHGRLEHAAQP